VDFLTRALFRSDKMLLFLEIWEGYQPHFALTDEIKDVPCCHTHTIAAATEKKKRKKEKKRKKLRKMPLIFNFRDPAFDDQILFH
jgi:hypothetical protein